MTLKQAMLNRGASQEHSASPHAPEDSPGSPRREGVPEAPAEDQQPIPPDVSALISDEVLRHRVRSFIEPKPTPSWFQRLINSQVFLTFLGFLLTGVIGGALTYFYTAKQQELTSQRSFSDELNKIRIQKIGEVWEQVDKNEVLLDAQLLEATKESVSDAKINQNVDAIKNLIQEDRVIINKNRFWLGEGNYQKLQEYLDKNVNMTLNMLLARPGTDFSEIIEERKRAKQDILQIREGMRSEGRSAS
ncbi:MAG TPA: hypothetical protein VJ866_02635 [Pyrinomonadaceae bacterium]|nr:hypothetical protein [Pyrinomonadaceae bacterium]